MNLYNVWKRQSLHYFLLWPIRLSIYSLWNWVPAFALEDFLVFLLQRCACECAPFCLLWRFPAKHDGINISIEVFRGATWQTFPIYIFRVKHISKINWHSHYIRVEKCQRCFWQKLFLSLHFWHLWHGPQNMLDSEQFQPKRIINVSI